MMGNEAPVPQRILDISLLVHQVRRVSFSKTTQQLNWDPLLCYHVIHAQPPGAWPLVCPNKLRFEEKTNLICQIPTLEILMSLKLKGTNQILDRVAYWQQYLHKLLDTIQPVPIKYKWPSPTFKLQLNPGPNAGLEMLLLQPKMMRTIRDCTWPVLGRFGCNSRWVRK